MKVFNPLTDNHSFFFIARDSFSDLEIELKNTFTNVVVNIEDVFFVEKNGYTIVTFIAVFEEGNKGLIKVVNENLEVVYRGHYLATKQDAQKYQLSTEKYSYARI